MKEEADLLSEFQYGVCQGVPFEAAQAGGVRTASGSSRPKAIFGLERCAQILGDRATARQRYQEFRTLWKTADSDGPELVQANAFLKAQ